MRPDARTLWLGLVQLGAMVRDASAIDPADVRAAFPELGPLEAAWAARAMGAADAPRRRLWRLAKRDPAWLPNAVEIHGAEVLDEPGPIVALAWHSGLADAIPTALAVRGRRGLTVSQNAKALVHVPGFEHRSLRATTTQRGAAVAHALSTLQRGDVVGIVVGFVDSLSARLPTPVPMLGRQVPLTRGPAMMARLGRARLVPCAAWLGAGRVVVSFAPPIAVDADDDVTTARVAAHFERELRGHPERLWADSLWPLLRLPRDPHGVDVR